MPFFDPHTTGAGDIALHPAVVNSIYAIAASQDGTAGNGDIALQISRLKDALCIDNATESISGFFRRTVAALGLDVQAANSTAENVAQYVQQLENRQESVSGVSLDEEMANMIAFQRAYEASARVVKVVDELMQTVLGMI